MVTAEKQSIIQQYQTFISSRTYPCVAARAAAQHERVNVFVADHMACPKDDEAIVNFLYGFVDAYRASPDFFHSAAILFCGPQTSSEEEFERMLWQRLQGIANIDGSRYAYDARVSSDVRSPNFSFSVKEEAFYIIGLHPSSSRRARTFAWPGMVFNPHQQFQALRQSKRYDKMKRIIRQRDTAFSGSVNPMLADFGNRSEVMQYSGRKLDESWQCPLQLNNR